MSAPGKTGTKYKHSDQERDNNSHDDTWGVNVVEIVGENAGGNALNRLKVGDDGAVLVSSSDIIAQLQALRGFQIPVYDEIAVTYPTTSSELYTYKLSSSDVATITVTYSDDTKANLTGVVFSAS